MLIVDQGLPVNGLELKLIELTKRKANLANIREQIVANQGQEAKVKELRAEEEEYTARIEALQNESKEIHADPNHIELTKEYFIVEKLKEDPNEEEAAREYRTGEFYRDAFRHAHANAVIGDTVGDPLKDTSGPSLNILVKLSSIISVIFGGVFVKTAILSHHR
ncbi:MAG: hypothetical protein GY861_07595 [bacterium]|nr:hypothetical protein [bacterium]